jgi:hypothetical protein
MDHMTLEDEGMMVFQVAGNYSSNDNESHCCGLESAAALL